MLFINNQLLSNKYKTIGTTNSADNMLVECDFRVGIHRHKILYEI
jgi:hypothetical protein